MEGGMTEDLKQKLSAWLERRADKYGFAPVEGFDNAPAGHHPSDLLQDAATVIVYAKALPKGILTSASYNLHLLQRAQHTIYPALDELGFDLASLLESQGYPSVLVPSYAPMVFHGFEPWGLISLKHAAELAGIGTFGRNGIIHNEEFGSMLRLGAVITSATIAGDPVIEKDPCPPKCSACIDACASGALQEDNFQKMVCMGYSIKHGLYRQLLGDEYGRENMEMIINTSGYNYWIDGDECLKACPNNRVKPRQA
jgi:epoxyqueuosine reductase